MPTRLAAGAAILGAIGQIAATALEPNLPTNSPANAMTLINNNSTWAIDRLVDFLSLLLVALALATYVRTLPARGRPWAALSQLFLAGFTTLGSTAILVGATRGTVASAWEAASPERRVAFEAVYTATDEAMSALSFGAFLMIAIYLTLLAAAVVLGRAYSRWFSSLLIGSAACLLIGDFAILVNDAAFILVLVGLGLFDVILLVLGVHLWRLPRSIGETAAVPVPLS